MTVDRVRGFPAFPAGVRQGRRFANSWWGNAWIKALEDTSLDQTLLTKGRWYAHAGLVGSITVSPGRIAADVHDDDLFRTQVFVEPLTDAEWERFLDEVAARAGHIAALLDRDMPHDLVASAEDAGVRLLPGIGDLEPDCDCPDWGHPCKHAAALCYQASWLLDADPFVLLLMRGRGEREVLDELQRRNAGPDQPAGVPAEVAYAQATSGLPAAPVLGPERALELTDPPGLEPGALGLLAADAAVRARDLLALAPRQLDLLAGSPPPRLDLWPDTVRFAATHAVPERLARASGRPGEFPRAVRAWEYGGAAGLDVLEKAWSPAAPELARARAALAAAWEGGDDAPALEWTRNRCELLGRGVQLRYGRDGRWYPYRDESGDWWPAGPPERDPAAALADLL